MDWKAFIVAALTCAKLISDAECRVACQSRDYDGGYADKNSCLCFHKRQLNQLVDHSIYLDSTRIKPRSEEY